jgi:transcriptional regulator with XRE-family HTH domain
MTKYEIAKRLGVSHQAIYKWYNGGQPSTKHLVALSRLLGISTDDTLKQLSKSKTIKNIPLKR